MSSGPQLGERLHNPCHVGGPGRLRAGEKIRSGPQVTRLATLPQPSKGSPTLHSGGQNQQRPGSGGIGCVTRAVWGIPNAAERGTNSEVAHQWANWLHNTCRVRGPQQLRNAQISYVIPAVTPVPKASVQSTK